MEGPRLKGGELVVAEVQFLEVAQSGEHALLKPPQAVPTQVQELCIQWKPSRDSVQSPVGTKYCPCLGGAVTHSGAATEAPSRQEEQEKEWGPWEPSLLWSGGCVHPLRPGIDDDMPSLESGFRGW